MDVNELDVIWVGIEGNACSLLTFLSSLRFQGFGLWGGFCGSYVTAGGSQYWFFALGGFPLFSFVF